MTGAARMDDADATDLVAPPLLSPQVRAGPRVGVHFDRGGEMRVKSITFVVAALGLVLVCAAASAPAPPPSFVVPQMTTGGGALPQDLAIGDFTTDGKQDVAVANLGPDAFNGGLAVLSGDGAGNLGAPIVTKLGSQQGALDISGPVDFDGDGDLDLALQAGTTGGPGSIMVLRGNGDGTFVIGQQLQGGAGHVEAGDLTGDGKADIVFVSSKGVAVVRLFAGNGDGTFASPIVYSVDFDAYDTELGDIDGDGDLDLVGAAGGPIWGMLQTGGGLGSQRYAFSQDLSGFRLALADFTRDGKLDVAVLTGDPGAGNPTLQIGRGTGDGSFTPLVHYGGTFGALMIRLNDGTGSFPKTVELIAPGGGVLAVDWTVDGRPDLLILKTSTRSQIGLYRNVTG
jgi:hypothetical protein